MLSQEIKRNIDTARDILVGKIPDPKGQIDQITSALIYKFMDDIDRSARAIPSGKASFFVGDMAKFAWHKLFAPRLNNQQKADLYTEGIGKLSEADHLPSLFHDIFKDAFVPFRAAETIALFLNAVNKFPAYQSNSEELGNAFEYLLHFMGTQGDAGQFRTPRHIIDFIVAAVSPSKDDTILDPACGTAGFLVSAYKHIVGTQQQLTQSEINTLSSNLSGVDIDPQMAKLARVNLYLHGFKTPRIDEDDTLTNEALWADKYNIILTNPPFMTPKGGIKPHGKFIIKAKRSEVLFVDYIAEHLRLKGRAGIVVPEGIVFQAANAYKDLRKKLIEDCGLYAVVSLPSGVFNPYSGVKTSILLLDRGFTCNELLFVKIDNDGYGLGAQRRKIAKDDLPTALTMIQQWKQTQHIPAEYETIAHSVSKAKIAEGGVHNLTGERYRKTVDYRNAKWPMVELGEVCEVTSGQSPEGKYYNEQQDGLPFYQGKTEFRDMFIGKPQKWTSKITKTAHKDDILMSVRAPVGPVNFAVEEICIGRGLASIRGYEEKINQKFLFCFLRNIEKSIIGGGGAVFDSISKKQIEQIKIPLPPLEIQEQIASEIDAYQKVIDGAKQVIANWNPSFRIDPDWEMVELGKVCEFNPKKSEIQELPKDKLVSFLPMSDLKEHQIYFQSVKTREIKEVYTGYTYFSDSDVLLARVTPCFENGKSGIAKNLKNKIGFGSSELLVYRANKDIILPEMIYYCVSSSDFIANGKSNMTGTGGLQRLTKEYATKYKIPLPPLNIQKQIVAEIEMEQEIVNANKKLIDKMEKKIKARITAVWGAGDSM